MAYFFYLCFDEASIATSFKTYNIIITDKYTYYNSNLIWRTVSCRVDELIPSDHPRREASSGEPMARRDTVRQIKLLSY